MGLFGTPDDERAERIRERASVDPAETTDDVPELAELAASDSVAARIAAIEGLSYVANAEPDAVAPVAEDVAAGLSDDDARVRGRAVSALGVLAEERPDAVADFVADVVPLLESDHEELRSAAAGTIRWVAEDHPDRAREAVDPLAGLLDDPSLDVRQMAARSLERVADAHPDAVVHLVDDVAGGLDDADAKVRAEVAGVLRWVAGDDPGPVADHGDALVECLYDGPFVQANAAGALRHLAAAMPWTVRPAVEDLVAVLDAPRPETRAQATAALDALAREYATELTGFVDQLAARLDGDDERSRRHAAAAIGRVARRQPGAATSAVDGLAERLSARDGAAAEAAAALRWVAKGHPDAVRPAADELRDALGAGDPTLEEQALAALAFVEYDHPGTVAPAIDAVRDALDHDDAAVRKQAARALERACDHDPLAPRPVLDRLVARFDEDEAKTRANALAAISYVAVEQPGAVVPHVEAVADLLDDGVTKVRDLAVTTLQSVADESPGAVRPAFGELVDRLDDADGDVRDAAGVTLTLVAGGDHRAAIDAADALLDRFDAEDPQVRLHAATTLGHGLTEEPEAFDDATVERFAALLDDDAVEVRAEAAATLGVLAGEAPERVPARHAERLAEVLRAHADVPDEVVERTESLVAGEEVGEGAAAAADGSGSAPDWDTITVEREGVSVEKWADAENFPVPTVRFRITNGTSDPVSVRVEDRVPEGYRVEEVGFHPEYGDEYWSATRSGRIYHERELAPHEGVETIYGIRATDGSDVLGDFLDEPDLTVDGSEGLAVAVESPPDRTLTALSGDPDLQQRLLGEVVAPAGDEARESQDVLLHGGSGSRRREVATAIAGQLDYSFLGASAGDLAGTGGSRVHERITDLLVEASGAEPCLLFVDDLGAIAGTERAAGIAEALEKLLDAAEEQEGVLFVGGVDDAGSLPESATADGRLDVVVRLADPGADGAAVADAPESVAGDGAVGAATDRPAESGDDGAEEPQGGTGDVAENVPSESTADYVPPQPPAPPADVEGVEDPPERDLTDVAGMEDLKRRLHEDVLLPSVDDEFEEWGFGGVTSIMLHGPPGTGKTYLAEALAGHLGYNYVEATAADFASDVVGRAPENVRDLFERAREAEPCLLFIDEIDAVAVDRGSSGSMSNSEKQMIGELLNEIDDLGDADEEVLLVAATNRIEDVDDAIERPGRFDARIAVREPDAESRVAILRHHLDDIPVDWDGVDEAEVADRTEGFSASHLAEVAEIAGRTAVQESGRDDPVVDADNLFAAIEDLRDQRKTDETARRFVEEPPDLDFDDVVGLEAVKATLREKVVEPLENPDLHEEVGLELQRGILLYGPPGTGKSHLAKSLAGELGVDYVAANAADLVSSLIGEGAKNVAEMFEAARTHQPCLVFVDEIESLVTDRSAQQTKSEQQMVTQFLESVSEIQDEEADVVVVAATNRPDVVDGAMKRPGRLGERIEIPPPGPDARVAIFRHYLEAEVADLDEAWLADETEGLSAAGMERLATESTRRAVNRRADEVGDLAEVDSEAVRITRDDVEAAIEDVGEESSDDRPSPTFN